ELRRFDPPLKGLSYPTKNGRSSPLRDDYRPGGAEGIRTPDLLHAMEARYQLRHSPERDSPEGDCASLTPATPRSPNRDSEACGGGIPLGDPPAGTALLEGGPVAVAEAAEHPPGETLLHPDELGDEGASGDAVGGDDDALPRIHRGDELVEGAAGAGGDVRERLPVP